MTVEDRQCMADKRISSGKSKLYRCTGAVIEPGVRGHRGALCLRERVCTQITSGMSQLPVWTSAAAVVQTGSCVMPLVFLLSPN